MPNLIPDEYSEKYRSLGWKLPENLEETVSKPHSDADITPDDVYSVLGNLDDEVLWLLLNNDKMTFCPGLDDA